MTNKIFKLLVILCDRSFLLALLKGTAAGTEHLKMLNDLDLHLITLDS